MDSSWSFEKDEMLIELVKTKPGLYDLQSPSYSDTNYKKRVWNEIGKAIGQSGAKNRWESLRGQYWKYLAKLKTRSGQAAAKITKWRFSDQMAFLNTFVNIERPRLTSITEDESIEEGVEREVEKPESTPLIQKRKNKAKTQKENASTTLMKYILEQKEDGRNNVDFIDTFFQLMATTVKNFDAKDQHLVKTRVFSLVSQIEEKYVLSSPSPSFSPSAATQQQNYFSPEPHTSYHITSPPHFIPPLQSTHNSNNMIDPQYDPPYPSTTPPARNNFNDN